MVSGGLSRTDVGRREVIGGYSLEFYWRAGTYYNLPQYLQDIAWYVEPKVAEAIFRQMLDEAGVTVLFEPPPAREGRRPQGRRAPRRHHHGERRRGSRPGSSPIAPTKAT